MRTIGFDDATTGLMVIMMSLMILTVETPSGILADRWSRKYVSILGAVSLGICAIILGTSNSVPIFIVGTLFWGIYNALYSGTYDSMIYDTILEEGQTSSRFQHMLGLLRVIEGSGFFAGAIIGGVIASQIGLRETYLYSLPLLAMAVLFLWRFKEPSLHKSGVPDPIFSHISKTFSSILKRRFLIPAVTASVLFSAVMTTTFELSQLWFIQLDTPIIWFGLIAAVLYSTWGFGGGIAKRLTNPVSVKVIGAVCVLSYGALIVSRSTIITFIAQCIACVGLVVLGILLLQYIHDNLSSKLRAGSASVIGSLTRIMIIPLTYLFTAVSHRFSVFSATFVLLGATIIASVAFSRVALSLKPESSRKLS